MLLRPPRRFVQIHPQRWSHATGTKSSLRRADPRDGARPHGGTRMRYMLKPQRFTEALRLLKRLGQPHSPFPRESPPRCSSVLKRARSAHRLHRRASGVPRPGPSSSPRGTREGAASRRRQRCAAAVAAAAQRAAAAAAAAAPRRARRRCPGDDANADPEPAADGEGPPGRARRRRPLPPGGVWRTRGRARGLEPREAPRSPVAGSARALWSRRGRVGHRGAAVFEANAG